jgi:hypothetical protein
VLECVH